MTGYSTDQLIALAIAVSFAAGLNLYAVLATLGLLAQAGLVTLPAPLAVIGDWWVIGISLTLFAIEFFADKIPMFDLVWNALQTFVRVPAGALLAYGTTSGLDPTLQVAAAVGGGALALAATGGKIAVRSSVTASPEPFTNIALSLGEDLTAIALTWFAMTYPWVAATIALIAVTMVLLIVRWVVRAIRAFVRGTGTWNDAPRSAPPA
jgi:hypothetical protein